MRAPDATRSMWAVRSLSGMLRMYCSRRACRRPRMWSCMNARAHAPDQGLRLGLPTEIPHVTMHYALAVLRSMQLQANF